MEVSKMMSNENRSPDTPSPAHVAILIPCFNEESSIARVVRDFRAACPGALVYVCDNASEDQTAEAARAAGAIVLSEHRRGKGNVMRRLFADVEADVFVMVDGDGTYDATTCPLMVNMLQDSQLDMIVGRRVPIDAEAEVEVYRRGHAMGNTLFSNGMRRLFGGEFTDVFSGYRVMSRRFVKSLPVRSTGFEIEAELSAHAVGIDAACAEVPTAYGSRGSESQSKLRTYRDGLRISFMLLKLFEEASPFTFFGMIACFLTLVALVLGIPVVDEFAHTGLVMRYPTAILAASIQIIAFLCFTCGIILRSVGKVKQELRRMAYLQVPAPGVTTRVLAEVKWEETSLRRSR
jgi:glycosyltransferase involved in cell wall biosynthesis